MKEIKHYTCENCGKLDLFKCMGTGLCEDCLQYLKHETERRMKDILKVNIENDRVGFEGKIKLNNLKELFEKFNKRTVEKEIKGVHKFAIITERVNGKLKYDIQPKQKNHIVLTALAYALIDATQKIDWSDEE